MKPVGTRTSRSWGRTRVGSDEWDQNKPEPLDVAMNPASASDPHAGHFAAAIDLRPRQVRSGKNVAGKFEKL